MNRIERQELLRHVENSFEVFTDEELSGLAKRLCELQIKRAREWTQKSGVDITV